MASKTTAKKKAAVRGGGGAAVLRSVVGGAAGGDALIDILDRLGLVDIVLGRVKSRIEETDIDEILDEATDYLRRNPEVLVVSLGAVTIATALLVWLNHRREWDGSERRGPGTGSGTRSTARPRTSSTPGRIKRTTPAPVSDDFEDE